MPPTARPLDDAALTALSDAQTQRLRDIFDAIDKDGSDDLDYSELKEVGLKALGYDMGAPPTYRCICTCTCSSIPAPVP